MRHLSMLFIVAMAVSICSGAANRSADGKSEDASREAGSARRQRHNEFVADNSQFGSLDGSSSMKRRIYVSEPDNLIDVLRETEEDRSSPHSPPLHFEIEADLSSEHDDGDLSHFRRLQTPEAGERPSSSTLLLQLTTASSAVSPETTFGFRSIEFSEETKSALDHVASKLTVLVNDPTKTRGLTVLSVNTESGKISGIQRGRSGNLRKLDMFELEGGKIVRSAAADHPVNWGVRKRMFIGPIVEKGKNQSFTCGVEHKEEWDERILMRDVHDGVRKGIGIRGRHDEHEHHDHKHHNHDHQHFNFRHLQSLFSDDKAQSAFTPPTNQRLYEKDGPAIRFQINMIIDIDAEFIQKQGGAAQAVEYINFLVTVANTILGNEVGVRLNVVHIQEVSYFTPLQNLRDGLKVMREQYDRKFPDNIQLRHALLGKYLGGGIAFIDAVCDERYGVGLSSGLEGKIDDLDEDAVYDLFIMMHEIGHSLGSDHTFESETFKPRIDTCGLQECPKELPLPNSASIMSYCDFCSGGLSNVALSMGGVWTGEHPRLDVKNWETSKEFTDLTVSKNPERVSHQIWKTLYGKGRCIIKQTAAPTLSPVTSNPSKQPLTHSPTLHPVTHPPTSLAPMTSSPTASPVTARPSTLRPTTSPSTIPTVNYGPFYISPLETCDGSCYLSRGIMFDVGLGTDAGKEILVESIIFEHANPRYADVSIDLYRTFIGTYEDKVKFSAQWNKLDTIQVRAALGLDAALDSYTASEFKLDPLVAVSSGDSFGFYVRASSSILRVGTGSNANVDKNGVFLSAGSTVMGGVFGIGIEGYLFNVNVKYSIVEPTAKPTRSSTNAPTDGPAPTSSAGSQSTTSLFAPSTAVAPSSSVISSPSFWLSPASSCRSNCLASSGFMFDMKLKFDTDRVLIKAIEFDHLTGSVDSLVDVYITYHGSLNGKSEHQWKKVSSIALLPNATSYNATAAFDPPISIWSGTTQGFFLQANEGILLVGFGSSDNLDEKHGLSIENGNVVFGQKRYPGYHLNARVGFDI